MKSEKIIMDIRNYIKNAIINNRSFNGHTEERCQIFELLLRVVQNGESNSALLIGPRGSGKTTLLKDVLSELQNHDEFSRNSITVKLHGLVHTDDRLALKSITSQMNLENVVDGKVFGSFAENMAFLLACLRTGQKHTSKSVIFILEEFDLFCSHHNQTLLYNLLDVSQSAQAPICVLGITCRLDVIELLEKRVKSRFSHRQIFLFPGIENEEQSDLEHMLSKLEQYLLIPEKSEVKINMAVKKQWNADIKSLLNDKKFKSLMLRLSEIDISERTLRHILFCKPFSENFTKYYFFKMLSKHGLCHTNLQINIIFRLDEDKLSLKMFQDEMDLMEKDDMIQILQDLNVVELCLVIAMNHHDEIYENQPMNFEMILTRYIKFANANSSIQSMPRPVIMKAFEHIQNLELISMISGSGTKMQKEYQFFKLLVTPHQISEAVKKSSGLPTEVIQWANSSLA